MKKILLTLSLSLFFTGCSYEWRESQSCLDSIPVAEQAGVQSAVRIVDYEEVTSVNLSTFEETKKTYTKYVSQCYLTCHSGYSQVFVGGTGKCLANDAPCLPSELPSGAVSGIKTLLSDGSYGACSISACSTGLTLQPDNTCAGVVPPPFLPPMLPSVPCSVDPSNPMCFP